MENIESNLKNAYNISRYIHNIVKKNDEVQQFSLKHFKDGPNPFYNQMKSGLILEEYYGTPSKIYTSIGYWNILGSTCSENLGFEKVMDILKNDLGLILLKKGDQTKKGYFGPYWKITKFDNNNLPETIEKDKTEYIDCANCKKIWSNFDREKKN